jgi:hypothetical protein
MQAKWLAATLLLIVVLAANAAQAQSAPQHLQVFLDRAPVGIRATGSDGLIARVRVLERPAYLIGRDQSGAPPPLPKDLFYARIQVVQALSGAAQEGTQLEVFFGVPGGGRLYAYPRTPQQLLRDYVIVSSVGEDGLRRPQEFPLEPEDYQRWEQEGRNAPHD